MTEHQHPITPPFELVEQWIEQCLTSRQLAAMAFQAGADAELEAVCEWLDVQKLAKHERMVAYLRAIRRPKPPSLKEQALTALTRYMTGKTILTNESVDTIRRALEALPE
jgi:hypothetical protein